MRRLFFSVAALIALTTTAEARDRVAVGTLECRSPGTISLILGVNDYSCVFLSDHGRAYRYAGRVVSLGLQAGITRNEVLIWRVFAPTAAVDQHALRGNYAGGHAAAAVIVGLGANVLVGGSNQTISLQPVSVEAKTGINFALAGAALSIY
jgi:Protein of unknown function (DUF992)